MTVHVKGPQALVRVLKKRMAAVPAKVNAACLKACEAGVLIAGRNLTTWSSRAGALDGIRLGLVPEATSTGAILHAQNPHSGFWEVGTRPHRIPLTALAEWAETWGAVEPYAVAKAYQMRVETYGTEPLWFMRLAIPEMNVILDMNLCASLQEPDAAPDDGGSGGGTTRPRDSQGRFLPKGAV